MASESEIEKATKVRELAKELTKRLTDEGKIIEGGFAGLKLAMGMDGVPQETVGLFRDCFFAGAHHLFSSIMVLLDEDASVEASIEETKKLDLIYKELQEFIEGFEKKYNVATYKDSLEKQRSCREPEKT